MAIKRQDEVLAKAAATDATVIPRYDIKRPDGTTVAANVALELKNEVVNEGTAVNKQLLDELLAASGTCGGTASALTLEQDGFILADGAEVRIKTSAFDIGAGATLNVNGTGAKNIIVPSGENFSGSVRAGVWLILIYSAELDGYIVVSKTMKTVTEIFTSSGIWTCPAGVKSVHVQVFGGGGAGGSCSDGGGGGGGGGGHMKSQTLSVVPGTTYQITIGAGATSVGGNGGATSFGTLLSANGGNGGKYNGGGNGGSGGGGPGGNGGDGGTGSYGGSGGKGGSYSYNHAASDGTPGIAAAGGDGAAGTAGTGRDSGGGAGGGFGGNGGKGGDGGANYGAGGGGGGGYGENGNGGNGENVSGGGGGNGGIAAGGGGEAYIPSASSSAGKGGNGIAIVTYVTEA